MSVNDGDGQLLQQSTKHLRSSMSVTEGSGCLSTKISGIQK